MYHIDVRVGSGNTLIISSEGFLRLWLVLAGIERIPPQDMITGLLLPPSYHFPPDPACAFIWGLVTTILVLNSHSGKIHNIFLTTIAAAAYWRHGYFWRWWRVSFSLLLSWRRSGKFSTTMGIYRTYPGRSRCDRLPQMARVCTLNNLKYDTFMSRYLSNPVRCHF
jgi:hypothetical protein